MPDSSADQKQKSTFDPTTAKPVQTNRPAFDPTTAKVVEKGLGGHVQDLGASLMSGLASVPDVAIGLGDLYTGGRAGKAVDGLSENFKLGNAQKYWHDQKTDVAKVQGQEFSDAEGIVDKAKVALSNPSSIANTVVESLPSMAVGGLLGRGLNVATKGAVGATTAGAVGEGAVMAGAQAEQIRQQTDDGLLTPTQAGLAAATGVAGSALGYLGGRLAQKLGFADVDTMMANGVRQEAVQQAAQEIPLSSIPKSVVLGAISEGVFEEMPQSMVETINQNIALDKQWNEGLDEAIVMGVLAGAAMGGTVAGVSKTGEYNRGRANAQQDDQAPEADSTGMNPLLPAPNGGAPSGTTLEGEFIPASQVDAQAQAARPNYEYDQFSTDADNQLQYGGQSRQYAPTPSQAMGIDPNAGPLSQAAATAVDTGVTQSLTPLLETATNAAQDQEGKQPTDSTAQTDSAMVPSDYRQLMGNQNEQNFTASRNGLDQSTQDNGRSTVNDANSNQATDLGRSSGNDGVDGETATHRSSVGIGSAGNTELDQTAQAASSANSLDTTGQTSDVSVQGKSTELEASHVQAKSNLDTQINGVEQQLATEKSVPKKLQLRQKLEGLKAKRGEIAAQQQTTEQQSKIENAAHEAASSTMNDLPEPTQAQIEAGNYKKGHIKVHGLDIAVENPRGSERRGTDPNGKAWSHQMSDHYGYIKRTTGADDEHIDTYVGRNPESEQVFVVDQIDQQSGGFDEHKVMMGFNSQEEAVQAYSSNFDKGWKVGPVRAMSKDEFKTWLKEGDTKKPASGTLTNEGTKQAQGKTEKVYTPQSNTPIEVRHKVVELDDLMTSHGTNGKVNEDYPQQLQPRDRSKQSYITEAHERAQKLNPERLGENQTTAHGAPIVNNSNHVESGNGRVLSLRLAYAQYTDKGEDYKTWLKQQGYNVDGMKQPVLVRERITPMTDAELASYTSESNNDGLAKMNATEQAIVDAKHIPEIIHLYQSDNELTSLKNTKFVSAFIDKVGKTERNKILDDENKLSKNGLERIQAAMMAAAYGDKFIVQQVFEDTDTDIKSIGNAMLDAAGKWMEMRQAVSSNIIPSDLDITANLIDAVRLVREARRENVMLSELVTQGDMFGKTIDPATLQFLSIFYRGSNYNGRARSRKDVATGLISYADLAQQQFVGENLFGETAQDNTQLLEVTNEKLNTEDERKGKSTDQQQDIFSSAETSSTSTDQGGRTGQRTAAQSTDEKTPTAEVNKAPRQKRASEFYTSAELKHLEKRWGSRSIEKLNEFVHEFDQKAKEQDQVIKAAGLGKRELDRAKQLKTQYQAEKKEVQGYIEYRKRLELEQQAEASLPEQVWQKHPSHEKTWVDNNGNLIVDDSRDRNGKRFPIFTVYRNETDLQQNRALDYGDSLPASKKQLKQILAEEAADQLQAQPKVSVPEKLKQKKAEKPVEKIEDFGEKLEGARKDQWKGYAQKLEGIISDPSKIQLAKYFPEPNYDQLIADGVDPKVVGFVMAARQAVPPKPRKSWKLDSWAAKVNSLRALVQEVIAQSIPFNKLMERMEGARGLNDLVIRIEAMESVGYPLMKHMSVDLNMGQAQYSFVRDQHGNELRNVKRYFMDQSPYLHHVYETKAEMFKDLKKHLEKIQADKEALSEANDKPQAKATKFDIFQSRYGGEYYVGKSIGRHQHMLSPTFKSLKEAQEYRREHHDALVKALEDAKFIAQHRRKTNNSRIGIDHRNGENVSPEQFSQTFGFRGVQFGNYVESDKRQADLNNAYDSLMDLSKLLNIPPQAISLNGSLGLSFGARGKGGSNPAAAHFERDTVVINLTKNSGAGSLAHEWWHALDNYFSRMRKQPLEMLSDRPSSSAVLDKENANSIRQEVLKAWENLVHTIRSSDLAKRSGKLDNKRSKPYWGTMVEMTARAFEKYVIDQAATRNESNDYLANIVHEHQYPNAEQFYPYPNAIESAKIDSAYDALFDTLETEKTDQGTRLYSRAQDDVTVGQSSDQVRAALVKRFGEKTIAALEQKGKLRIVESYEVEGVEGYYHNGRVTLVANNLTESSIIPTFLHELGGHGGFQNTMSKQQYAELMRQFDEMVKRKHPIAMEAKRLAEREANSKTQKLEYLPYMLTLASTMQVTNALQKSALRQFIDKVVSAVKAFMFDKMGVQLNLAPDDLVALAERMVARQTSEPTSEDRVRAQYFGTKEWMKAPNGKPSKLTEQQWLQVRTPEFKNWFGDWQNDPENASQMVDENGEPQVLYHGTPEKFYNFKLGGGLLGRGVYLTNDVSTAEMYSQIRAKSADQQGYILPLFANIRKAFEAGARTTSDLMHSDVLRERFNGIMMSLEDQVKYIVAFKPEQVKLATGNTGWFDGLVSDIRYAYAGTYAREANADTLAQAERMQNNGVPSERIRRETGWFVGMDGEWRFEIDDSQSSINEKALADLKDGMVMRIADVLNHDGLYANYPHLRNIQLLSEVSSERGGSFNRSFNPYITINEDYLNDPEMVRSILIHELQHAIQYHEGFAEGGNPKMADRVLQELRQLSHIKSRESHNAQYEAGDAIAERDAIRHQLRQLSMFESMRKLREYANMDKPSSQLRHLRNHFSTITYMDYEATSGLIQLDQEARYALRDLQRDWYAVGKRTQKQFNPRLREVSWKAAELLESLIDPQLLQQFKASDVSLKTFRNRLNRRIDQLYEQRIKEADQKKAEYENFSQRLERVQRLSPHMVYMSLSGEIEARDVQERLKLNAEQRTNQRPYSSQNEYTDHAIVVRDRQVDPVGISSNPLYSRQAAATDIIKNIVANMNKQGAAKLKTEAGYKAKHALQYVLGALGRRQLTELYEKLLPQLKPYSDMVAMMDADQNEVAAMSDDLARRWSDLKDEKELANIMHDATLAKIDPAKPYVPGDSVVQYAKLKKQFDALSPDAQKVYREARDAYKKHHRNVRQAIQDRILRSSMSNQKKTELLQQMDANFFGYTQGVYFPLQRFGKYVVLVRDNNDQVVSVSRAETLSEAHKLREILQGEYPNHKVVKPMLDKEYDAGRDGVGRGFMTTLFNELGSFGMDAQRQAELEDILGQLYLKSLPDLSYAKHSVHRKGTAGFSQDARRAFAQNMFHGGSYLAKLRYKDQLEEMLDGMQKHATEQAKVDDNFDQPVAQQVIDEMNKRHKNMMEANSHPLSSALTSVGFLYYLGLSPASATVNLLQTVLVAYPQMGAKWGFDKAGSALTQASNDFRKGLKFNGFNPKNWENDIAKVLKGDDLTAYKEAVRRGVIDVTMAHDLAGIAQGEDSGVMWKLRPIMRVASTLFHNAERFNREVTFIAGYRLARDSGLMHEQAFEQAMESTYKGHFDYSAGNRPRVMQGNVAKVIFLFKQFGQNMLYTLMRAAHQSFKGETPAAKREALRALVGMIASHTVFAGAMGLPMVSTTLSAISFLSGFAIFGGSDDEPWDAEVALRNNLSDLVGVKASEVLMKGAPRLTPIDLSGRVGINNLLIPDVQDGLEGKDYSDAMVMSALGPVVGMLTNTFKGMAEMGQGHGLRGVETMSPVFLRSPLRSIRYATEGAQDKTGVMIKDDVGMFGLAAQAIGFSPSEVRLATEGRSAIYSHTKRLDKRRTELMNQYVRAIQQDDKRDQDQIWSEIQSFNQKNPERRISKVQAMQSLRQRQKRVDQAEHGIYLAKKKRGDTEIGRFAFDE